MTAQDVCREISRLVERLRDAQLLWGWNKVIVLGDGPERKVTWAGEDTSVARYGEVAALQDYIDQLNGQQYVAVLYDGAILQLSYEFNYDRLVKHRLLFWPCPVQFNEEDLNEFNLSDLVELALASDEVTNRVCLVNPIRFDYDRDACRPDHPASHAHLGRSACRIPVRAPLSVGHFVDFVFREFYPQEWRSYEWLSSWPKHEFDESVTQEERLRLHFSWRTS